MFFIAAGLVLVCQLVAMALVADGQVEKAHVREASQASFQAAMASCVANTRGIDMKDCTRLVPPGAVQASKSESAATDSQGFTLVTLANRY